MSLASLGRRLKAPRSAILPTPRMAWLAALALPLAALLLTVLGARWPLALVPSLACLALALADLSMTPKGPLQPKIELEGECLLGAEIFALLTIPPPGRLSRTVSLEAELEMSGPAGLFDPPRASGILGPEGLAINLPLIPRRRGTLTATRLWLRWQGPLGLCRIQRIHELDLRVDVSQNVGGLHQAALRFFHREAEVGRKSQPFKGEGSEFDSLMDYSVGMDNRLIDWKRSARHRKLLAKEFRQERNHQILLCFDTGRLLTEPVNGVPKLDRFIRSGLLLGWVSLLSGDMVGACAFDLSFRSYLKPGRGRNFFARLRRYTAGLDYRTLETNFTVGLTEIQSRLPHRSLVIVFTEFIDQVAAELLVEGLALLAKKHMVIFVTTPDPLLGTLRDAWPATIGSLASSVIAEDFQRDRAIVRQKAARHGVHCLDVPPGELSTAILNRYLVIKQRGLL